MFSQQPNSRAKILPVKLILALAAVHSKAVVLLLFINCLLLFLLFMGFLCLGLVLLCGAWYSF